ncbi:MAG: (d)CMP kinase [Chloroflexi bacterium]|nr:(d)CMP kinase [Chloroflexota bacterium]MYF21212.1 (d)CMP kinase [Chloroflexota bacterium]
MTDASESGCERCIVAIDGPVASGKTVVGRALAQRLGWRLFDTGIMYRAAAWQVLQNKVPLDEDESVAELIRDSRFELRDAPGRDSVGLDVYVNGRDITPHIREADVESTVTVVAANRQVREMMVAHQQNQASRGCMIVVGRDIGTVVLPHAPVKIFLDASEEVRARRRAAEQNAGADEESVLVATRRRDARDRSRRASPLVAATDAITLDTSNLTLEESIDTAEQIVRQRIPDLSASSDAGPAESG